MASKAWAEDPGMVVVAVSPADERAVIQQRGSSSEVHRVGDELAKGRYVVRSIRGDHVVLEERRKDTTPVEVRLYVADETGRSRVQRIETSANAPPEIRRNVSTASHRPASLEAESLHD